MGRMVTLGLIGLVTLANIASVALLVHHLLNANVTQGRDLIYSAVSVWLTNVIVYGCGSGRSTAETSPARGRRDVTARHPVSADGESVTCAKDWRPRFFDYLFTSFANGTSFAPADAMP